MLKRLLSRIQYKRKTATKESDEVMISQLASDWLKTKEFQSVINDVMRMLRNYMGNKTFLITYQSNKKVTILQSVEGSVKIHEGLSYSSNEAVYHQWDEKTKDILVVNDTRNSELAQGKELCDRFGIGSYLGVPLILKNGNFFGTLCAIDSDAYTFTEIDVDTMKTLGSLLVQAIELHRLTVIDHLTGLYNKSYLDRKLEQLANHKKSRELLSIILFDVDNFKMINDTYGHSVGDEVLEFIGQCVRKSMPNFSIPFRFGGDEFCIFLPELSAKQTLLYVGDLRERLSNFRPTTISLSIGISDTTLSSIDSLLDTADIALYKAKKKGKNQYSIYVD